MSSPSGFEQAPRTVADQIRALAAQGHARADIARMLGKRYQHVRNVLEGDKLRGGVATSGDPARNTVGVAEASIPFGGVHRLSIEADGTVRLPADVLGVLGAPAGGVLIGVLEADRFVILSGHAAMDRVRALVASLSIDPKRVLSEELIAERRAEAAADD